MIAVDLAVGKSNLLSQFFLDEFDQNSKVGISDVGGGVESKGRR